MTMAVQSTAYGAFESQLKTLCLNEFPCGIGTWKENYGQPRKLVEKDKVNSKFSVTLKDFGAKHDKTETLEELVTAKHSPWNIDYSWSDEARKLREIAVQSPWLIDKSFVLSHFRTLRIVDKGVEVVDPQFLQFTCLEELCLSVNKLCTVNSAHLPNSLRVLELAANNISNLADLCSHAPLLTHLGLGYNSLTLVDDYITGDYWPQLLSLDLSHNNLCDLMDIIKKLQSMPKLRNLILQGNPLALLAAYRGYTIDSLRRLAFLDDISISADERHHYKGLAKRKEHILDETKVSFHVAYIKGVPMPPELKTPEDQPEYPIVTRKYFVQFMYPKDKPNDAEMFRILQDDQFSMLQSSQMLGNMDAMTTTQESTGSALGPPEIHVNQGTPSVSRQDDATQGTVSADPAKDTGSSQLQDRGDAVSRADSVFIPEQNPEDDGPHLAPVKSAFCEWAEEMPVQWTCVVARDDLLTLRNFYETGMELSVVEEMVRSFPPGQMEATAPSPSPSNRSKKKETPKETSKSAKTDKVDSKKKKKGEPDIDLVHMPPEYTTIASFHMPLAGFLDGEFKQKKTFSFDWENGPRAVTPTNSEVSSRRPEGKKDKKKKPDSASSRMGKGKKDGKKEDKAAKVKATDIIDEDGPPPPQPPLEMQVCLRLHHWKTAHDSMKPDPDEQPAETDSKQGQS